MARVFTHPRELLDAVGTALGPSDLMAVEQQRIDLFAEATDDHQWIHVDPQRAADGPFGGCIAHGYLTLSLVNRFLPQLIEVQNMTMGVNYGCERIRFPNVVKAGQRIRASGEIVAVEEKPNAVQSTVRVTISVEGSDRPACVADTISRYYFDPADS
jgi:acyl dehydratase